MSRPTAPTGQSSKKMPLPRPPPSPQCISSASPRQHSELSVFLHTDEDGGSPSNHKVTGSLAEPKEGEKKIDRVLSDFSSLLTRADKSSALIRLGSVVRWFDSLNQFPHEGKPAQKTEIAA